jgi:hypothetical protein
MEFGSVDMVIYGEIQKQTASLPAISKHRSGFLSDLNLKVGSVPSAPRKLPVKSKEKISLLVAVDERKLNLGISSVVPGRVLGGEASVGVGGGSKRELGALGTGNVKLKPLLIFLSEASAAEVDVTPDFKNS